MSYGSDGSEVIKELERRTKSSTRLLVADLVAIFVGLMSCQGVRILANGRLVVEMNFFYFAVIFVVLLLVGWYHFTIRRRRAKLLEAVRSLIVAREQLVGDVLHDMKAPINTISAKAQRAVAEGKDYEVALEKIIAECVKMSKSIEENIEITNNYTGKVVGEPVFIDMSSLVADIAEDLHDVARAKDVALCCRIADDRMTLTAISSKMDTLVTNLVENAVKYTKPGGKVTVSLRRDGKKMILRVRDTGIGMSEETMKHMYERRYRGEEATSQGFDGTGLGLAHVKSVVVLYNGDISCESAVGKGTTFIVTLPLTMASHTR